MEILRTATCGDDDDHASGADDASYDGVRESHDDRDDGHDGADGHSGAGARSGLDTGPSDNRHSRRTHRPNHHHIAAVSPGHPENHHKDKKTP